MGMEDAEIRKQAGITQEEVDKEVWKTLTAIGDLAIAAMDMMRQLAVQQLHERKNEKIG